MATTSSAWLLRLFQSQQFFNCWIAVNYLFKYGNSIGIQHYLCRRLQEFPLAEIEFLLPQLLQKSMAALEAFLLDCCRRSSHITLLMLWYLEAYLNELVDTEALMICQMMHEKCLSVLSDSVSPSTSPLTASTAFQPAFGEISTVERRRVERLQLDFEGRTVLTARSNAMPAIVGMSSALASLASPWIMQVTQEMVLVEGERFNIAEELARIQLQSPSSPSRTMSLSLPASQAELASMIFQQNPSQRKLNQQTSAGDGEEDRQSLLSLNGSRYRRPSAASLPSKLQPQLKGTTATMPSSTSANKRSLASSLLFSTGKRQAQKKQFQQSKQGSVSSITQAAPSVEDLNSGEAFSLHRFMIKTNSYHNLRKLYSSRSGRASASATDSRPATSADDYLQQTFDESSSSSPPLPPAARNRVQQTNGDRRVIMDDLSSLVLLQSSGHSSLDDDSGPQQETLPASNSPKLPNSPPSMPTRIGGDSQASTIETAAIDPNRRAALADKHYFHSELQFVSALMEISSRLISVPREARLSSLRAELALLNHNFPARVCIPLWCEATADQPYHHQLVRICPEEAVVLNSADRVPYLILVEVLETDADHPDGFMQELQQLVERAESRQGHFANLISPLPSQLRPLLSDNDGANQSSLLKAPSLQASPGFDGSAAAGAPVEVALFKNYRSSDYDAGIGMLKSPTAELSAAPLDPQLQPPSAESNTGQNMQLSTTSPSSVRGKDTRVSGTGFLSRMRTAAIMLAQLADPINSIRPVQQREIRARILKEMVLLEEQRVKEVTAAAANPAKSSGGAAISQRGSSPFMEEQVDGISGEEEAILNDSHQLKINMLKEDPSALVLNENWGEKCRRIRKGSPYGSFPTWRLLSVIVKSGADLRQEQLACQLIREMHNIWQQERLELWVYNFKILVTSDQGGLIETIPNTISVHSLKKQAHSRGEASVNKPHSLYDYFRKLYGKPTTESFQRARQHFMHSLAGYSLATYILAIKDRHNGNILLDSDGHIIHIDFGFMLSNSPGAVGFESAPFKLSAEYVDILGGLKSPEFAQFKNLLFTGMQALRKHADKIILLVEMLQTGSKLPCFSGNPEATIQALRDRFMLSMTERQVQESIDRMVWSSFDNIFSRLYDSFQYYSNGIL